MCTINKSAHTKKCLETSLMIFVYVFCLFGFYEISTIVDDLMLNSRKPERATVI